MNDENLSNDETQVRDSDDPQAIQFMLNDGMIEPDKTYVRGGTTYGVVGEFVFRSKYIADGVYLWRYDHEK